MPQIVSKTGAAIIELGAWVNSTGNAAYVQLMKDHLSSLKSGAPIADPAFNAMVEQFLVSTNQEII